MASAAPAYEERRMSIGRVFQRAFSTIAHNPAVFVLVLLFGVLPSVLFTYAMTFAQSVDWNAGNALAIGASFLAGWVVSLVIAGILQGALTRATLAEAERARASFAECVSTGFRTCLPLVLVNFIYFISIAIASILLFIPGILVMLIWSVAAPAFVGERQGVMRSFGRSFELTKGHRWRIFGLMLVLGVIYLLVFTFLGILGLQTLTPVSPGEFGLSNIIASTITALIINLLWGTIQPSLYLELRGSREGDSVRSLEEVFA